MQTRFLPGLLALLAEAGGSALSFAEHVYEPAYTTLEIEVATTTDAFRDTALAATVDTRLDPAGLDAAVRQLLERVTAQDTYRETTPLSTEYTQYLTKLGTDTAPRPQMKATTGVAER